MSTAAHSLWKWVAVCCLVVCVMLSTLCPAHAKRLWVASVTVVDSRLLEHGPSALKGKDAEHHMADLACLAKSRTVMERTMDTLSEFDLAKDPARALSTLDIKPVPGTSMLVFKVTSPNDAEARAAVDAIANEFIEFYDEVIQKDLGNAPSTTGEAKSSPVLRLVDAPAVRPAPPAFKRIRRIIIYLVLPWTLFVICTPCAYFLGRRSGMRRAQRS